MGFSTLVLMNPDIYIGFQAYYKPDKMVHKIVCDRCLIHLITQFSETSVFHKKPHIFHHLKLEIVSAIPALNE